MIEIFSKAEQDSIIDAIENAEDKTTGEIKVHLEPTCAGGDTMTRAKEVFEYLSLHKTVARNGVLFYVAYEERKFAILGDQGIDTAVGPGYWDSIAAGLKAHFMKNNIVLGLLNAINETGEKLAVHFPGENVDNPNEIPNDISFGK